MGYMLIDNSQGPPLPNIPNTKTEMDTVSCVHCNAVIALLRRGCNQFSLSSIDMAIASGKAHEASQHYVANYRCSRCRTNICRRCSKWMEDHGGTCPGPFKAKIEAAMKKMRDVENFHYQYRSVAR